MKNELEILDIAAWVLPPPPVRIDTGLAATAAFAATLALMVIAGLLSWWQL